MVNTDVRLSGIVEYFSPKVIAEVEDMYVKLAKIKGDDIPWHSHESEDEMFYILDGELLMEIEGKDAFLMHKGDLQVIKKGIKHRVSSDQECSIMLIEKKSTLHTGEVDCDITKSIEDQAK